MRNENVGDCLAPRQKQEKFEWGEGRRVKRKQSRLDSARKKLTKTSPVSQDLEERMRVSLDGVWAGEARGR